MGKPWHVFFWSIRRACLLDFDVQAHHILVQGAQLASLTYGGLLLAWVLQGGAGHDRAAEWAFQDVLGARVIDGPQRVHAEIAVDFLQVDVEVLIEVKFVRVRAFGLEGRVVLFVLCYHVRLVGEEASWLQVEDEAGEVRRRDEVLYFVIVLQGILVDEELVRPVHSAERHVATQFGHSNRVV